jgi:hypothetical protein
VHCAVKTQPDEHSRRPQPDGRVAISDARLTCTLGPAFEQH